MNLKLKSMKSIKIKPISPKEIPEVAKGVFDGLIRIARSKHLWLNYCLIPIGTIAMLAVSYATNLLFQLKPVEFPSSVMVLAVLFTGIMLTERIFGSKVSDTLMHYFNIPGKFLLKWLAVCFSGAFITLPLSQHVTVGQAWSMGLIFIIGLAFYLGLCAYMALAVDWFVKLFHKQKINDEEKQAEDCFDLEEEPSEESETAASSDVENGEPMVDNIIMNPTEADKVEKEEEKRDPETPLSVREQSSNFVYNNFDDIFYFTLFWCGLIVYYSRGYAMIMHTAMVAFVFRQVNKLPPKLKRYLSPVIVTAAICMLLILITALIGNSHKPKDFMNDLRHFKTGRNYLYLVNNYRHWNVVNSNGMYHRLPGAGDVYSSFMDAGIIAMLVPLYEYRAELIEHWIMLIVPIGSGAIHFFCYPAICYRLFLTSEQALGFAARSATLALATPVTEGLGGNIQVTAVTGVLSGIVGVLIGDFLLEKVYRVPMDNFMVIGITYGTNSSAVAATTLLASDRRTGAIASLSFVLFGITLVVLTAIPPVANVAKHLAGK
ncbi:hypothetical protein CJU90_2882 [Yarrowia sp. C11]|nr:hypothetical protein CKK34_4329 [Yarrowia sp. E02]KAG5369429.1 hypothetical protein CJU90_2882 [Yarrowia sp. C11]